MVVVGLNGSKMTDYEQNSLSGVIGKNLTGLELARSFRRSSLLLACF